MVPTAGHVQRMRNTCAVCVLREKEWGVCVHEGPPVRLSSQLYLSCWHAEPLLLQIAEVPLYGKMAGAVGNYNAHMSAYPDIDWQQVAQTFVCDRMGVQWNPYVTQVSLQSWVWVCPYSLSYQSESLSSFRNQFAFFIKMGLDQCQGADEVP